MTEFNPTMTEKEISLALSAKVKAIIGVSNNPYDGKYAATFISVYEELMTTISEIREVFEDGFQLSDIDSVIAVAIPSVMEIYRAVGGIEIEDTELEAFMADLVMFTYYEVSDLIKWTWLKWLTKLFFKFYATKKLGRTLADLVRYIDGKLEKSQVDDKILKLYQGVRNWL